MPRMSGDETRNRLAKLAPALPAVTMSGWHSGEIGAGDLVLDKPFTPSRLLGVVEQASGVGISYRRSTG